MVRPQLTPAKKEGIWSCPTHGKEAMTRLRGKRICHLCGFTKSDISLSKTPVIQTHGKGTGFHERKNG